MTTSEKIQACQCDPFIPKWTSHRGADGWLVCGRCGGKIGAGSEIEKAKAIAAEALDAAQPGHPARAKGVERLAKDLVATTSLDPNQDQDGGRLPDLPADGHDLEDAVGIAPVERRADAQPGDVFGVEFRPIDPLNPGSGYSLRIERNGSCVLFTGRAGMGGGDLLTPGDCVDELVEWVGSGANARLIAAAPALLTACRLALPVLREFREAIFSSNQIDGVVHDAVEKADLDMIDAVILLAGNAVDNAEGGGS